MKVWLNGSLVDRDAALVSAFDAGLLHGVGLFETLSARNGHIYRLREHLQRLRGSAIELRLTDTLSIDPLALAVQQNVDEAGLDHARVRLTLTGGDLNLLETRRQTPAHPTIIITAQPATEYPAEFFERGVTVAIADGRLNPLDPHAGHKTVNYWPRLRALQDAAARRAAETLFFSVTNHLMSGAVSNVFLVSQGTLRTSFSRGEEEPGSLPSPVLPGITRAAVIELADGLSIGTGRSMLTIDDLLDADEVFLTNSSWGILPVVAIDYDEPRTIGDGVPGRITSRLRQALEEDVAAG